MLFSKALVFLFVATIGTLWSPGGHSSGFASAKPSLLSDIGKELSSNKFLDEVVGAVAEFKSLVPSLPGSGPWFAEHTYVALEKKLNLPTHYGSKLAILKNKGGDQFYYVINAHDIHGPINFQTKNTINPGLSDGKVVFGSTTVQKGNSYVTEESKDSNRSQ